MLRPGYERCLISLSRGGADAVVVREFDLGRRAFVEDAFTLPEAKGRVGSAGSTPTPSTSPPTSGLVR
ncbi:hypothetical protein JNW88_02620 [Micromonospora sp. ATA32]|nr:hypothetical protein [Micromonospora sp. ATA32]